MSKPKLWLAISLAPGMCTWPRNWLPVCVVCDVWRVWHGLWCVCGMRYVCDMWCVRDCDVCVACDMCVWCGVCVCVWGMCVWYVVCTIMVLGISTKKWLCTCTHTDHHFAEPVQHCLVEHQLSILTTGLQLERQLLLHREHGMRTVESEYSEKHKTKTVHSKTCLKQVVITL